MLAILATVLATELRTSMERPTETALSRAKCFRAWLQTTDDLVLTNERFVIIQQTNGLLLTLTYKCIYINAVVK